MKKFLFDCGTRDATASLGIFALRVLIGLMMLIGHGIPKIQEFAARKDLFYVPDFFPLKYMSPPVSLMAAITAEVGASLLIILGLATRPAAFLLGIQHGGGGFRLSMEPLHGSSSRRPSWTPRNSRLLYLIPMIAIILSGAGAYSLDAGHLQGRQTPPLVNPMETHRLVLPG